MNKSDIALVVSAVSLLISASIFYLHLRRYRSETKPHLKVSLKRTKDQFEVRALNASRGPIVIESFGFKAAGKQFAIRMYRYSSGSQIPFPNSIKLKQNEAYVEKWNDGIISDPRGGAKPERQLWNPRFVCGFSIESMEKR